MTNQGCFFVRSIITLAHHFVVGAVPYPRLGLAAVRVNLEALLSLTQQGFTEGISTVWRSGWLHIIAISVSAYSSLRSGPCPSLFGPFHNQVPLKISHRGQNSQLELASGCGGINGLGDGYEIDPVLSLTVLRFLGEHLHDWQPSAGLQHQAICRHEL